MLSSRYRLIHQMGAGGMGSVWLAQDLNLDTEVAIKLIDPAIAESAEAVGRFRQEAQAAAMIRSSHVVQILDHGVDLGRPFIAMELLRGENLGQRLEQHGRLDPAQTGHILGQVGRALSLAHARGIVHRDLKPDNIFLVREGDEEITKVLDFGVARRLGGLTDSSLSKTRTGAMLGTPYYMSPEQATGQPVDHLSDIWSFGVIALECLTQARAFDGESVGALFHAICMLPMPVPSKLGAVPPGFDEWFAKAVHRDLGKRYTSIRQASEDLRQVCGRHSASMRVSTLSGERGELSSYAGLTTTAVSAVATELDQTSPPSTKTLPGRLKKRPITTALVACSVLGLGILGLMLRAPAHSAAQASAVGAPSAATLEKSAQPEPILGHPSDMAAAGTALESSSKAAKASPAADAAIAAAALANSKSQATSPTPARGTAQTQASVQPPRALVTKSQATTSQAVAGKAKRTEKKSFIKRDDNAAGI